MDGIATIGQRMAAIQSTLGQLAPRPAAVVVGTTALQPAAAGGSPSRTDGTFETALTREVTRTSTLPSVPGFTAEQVGNARAVVQAGRSMGLSLRDQAIGVMTAIGESSLRVLDHGDTAGPDSRGLFQQRDNGAWGTLEQRMDPTESARSFFRALRQVDGRASMAPTLVAHAVQRNADPNHYARSWDDAVRLVSRLTGASPAQITG